MIDLLATSIVFSLIITAIHISFWQGMIFGIFRVDVLDKICPKILRKPLYECLPCMASIWTIVLSIAFGILSIKPIVLILIVCGINALIDSFLNYCSHNPLN